MAKQRASHPVMRFIEERLASLPKYASRHENSTISREYGLKNLGDDAASRATTLSDKHRACSLCAALNVRPIELQVPPLVTHLVSDTVAYIRNLSEIEESRGRTMPNTEDGNEISRTPPQAQPPVLSAPQQHPRRRHQAGSLLSVRRLPRRMLPRVPGMVLQPVTHASSTYVQAAPSMRTQAAAYPLLAHPTRSPPCSRSSVQVPPSTPARSPKAVISPLPQSADSGLLRTPPLKVERPVPSHV